MQRLAEFQPDHPATDHDDPGAGGEAGCVRVGHGAAEAIRGAASGMHRPHISPSVPAMKELIYHRLLLPAVERNADRLCATNAATGNSTTYAVHFDRVQRLIGALRGLGVGRGDRFAVMTLNSPEYLEMYHAAFLGGGVVEAAPEFRDWFLDLVREHTVLRDEQRAAAEFALVTDLDMAGARGAAVAARNVHPLHH